MLFIEKIKHINKFQIVAALIATVIAFICLLQINILNTYAEPVQHTLEDKNIDLNLNCPVSDTIISFTPKQNRIKNIRFILSQIPSDGSGMIEVTLSHNEKLLYRGLRACSNIKVGEWANFGTNIVLDTTETYDLHIIINNTELTEIGRASCRERV